MVNAPVTNRAVITEGWIPVALAERKGPGSDVLWPEDGFLRRASRCCWHRSTNVDGSTVRRRRGRKQAADTRAQTMVEARPNARWLIDFVHDHLVSGRRLRILNVINDVTKECLAAVVDTSISGRRVARELQVIVAKGGKPEPIVSYHGNEFTSNTKLAWKQSTGIA